MAPELIQAWIFAVLCACVDPASDKGGPPVETGDTSDTGETTEPPSDVDQDGYTVAGGDCDDHNGQVYPGAAESPAYNGGDGLDNDCDGVVDEGTLAYDDDGDGLTERQGDCDDSDPDIYLGQAEVPGDGVDQSCDGSDAGPVRALADADAIWVAEGEHLTTGWSLGLATSPEDGTVTDVILGAPRQWVGYGDKSNRSEANPRLYRITNAATGGGLLEDVPDLIVTTGYYYWDLGATFSAGVDVDGDGYDDVLIGMPDNFHDDDEDGCVYKSLLYAGPLVGEVDPTLPDWRLCPEVPAEFESTGVALLPDLGDGGGGQGIGSPWRDDGYGSAAIYAWDGAAEASLADAQCLLEGEQIADYAGYVLARAGDLDGDGVDELAVAAIQSYLDGYNAGAVYLVPVTTTGTGTLADMDGALLGVGGQFAGLGLAPAGDLNGDGYADLLVGGGYGNSGGGAWIAQGPVASRQALADAEVRFTPETEGDHLGWAVSSAGDFDADGAPDVAISAPHASGGGASYPGRAYLFRGPLAGAVSGASADLVLPGEAVGNSAGAALAGGRDLNRDGYDDLVIGAPDNSEVGEVAGKAYAVFGYGL